MAPLFNTAYLAFLDHRIKRLEAEQASDDAYQTKHRVDILLDEVLAQIRANDNQLEVDSDNAGWAARNARLVAEKTRLQGFVKPLPERSKKVLLKLRLYKLRRHVFTMYVNRRRTIEMVNVHRVPDA